MIGLLSQTISVCAILSNFQEPILKNNNATKWKYSYSVCLYSPPLDNNCGREEELLLLCMCSTYDRGVHIT